MLTFCLVHFFFQALTEPKAALQAILHQTMMMFGISSLTSTGREQHSFRLYGPLCRVGIVLPQVKALFTRTAEMVRGMGENKTSRVQNFCEFMSKGQSMDSAGSGRVGFYKDISNWARQANYGVGVFLLSAFSYSYFQRK